MGAQAKRCQQIARQVAVLRANERAEKSPWKRRLVWLMRWAYMLLHEILRDRVKIRAESLAYLSLFSLLPLLAGAFFLFTVLTQFGMVQDALQGFVSTFLDNIPPEHREFVNEYVLRFQQSYLTMVQERSGTIGVFALLILAYVGLQAFSNIDHTLNDIWGSDTQRPFLEKLRNFIVVVVVAPILLIGGYSVPLILQKVPVTSFVLDSLPFLKVLLNFLVPVTLLMATFFAMYRFVPVVRVRWKAAAIGALFATIGFEITNVLLRIYFSFFTHSAYGKLATVPIIAFWLFVVWMVIILGAEVSFLVENENDIVARADESPTFSEARGLVAVVANLHGSYILGNGPVSWDWLLDKATLGAESMRKVMDFLLARGWVAEVLADGSTGARTFLPAKNLSEIRVSVLLSDFLKFQPDSNERTVWSKEWNSSMDSWLAHFGKKSIADLLNQRAVSNQKEK
jgi:membrane protein